MLQLSDGQTFILILVVFYLWECIHWVKPGSVGYVRYLTRWRFRFSGNVLYGRNRAVLFNPWPGFFCPGFSAGEPPFEFTPDGLVIQGTVELPWDELNLRREGSTLVFGAVAKLNLSGAAEAKEIAGLLIRLSETSPNIRERHIRVFYKKHLSRTRSLRLVKRFRKLTDQLQFNGLVLMILFFVLIPFAYITKKESLAFAGSLLVALFMVIAQAVWAFFVTRRLYPGNSKYAVAVAVNCLFPWHAMHVGQSLLHQALPLQHPLAVSASLLPKEQFVKHLSAYWRTLEYGKVRKPGSYLREALLEFIKNEGVGIESLLKAPPRDGKDSAAYCPGCHAQYHAGIQTCSDCRGVKLIPFESE